MPDPKPPEGNSDPGSAPQTLTLEIDGEAKTFSAEDVTNLVAQQASATQASQQASAAIKVAEQFGVPVEDLMTEAKNSFAVVQRLLDEGVIDTNGKVLVQAPAAPVAPAAPASPAPAAQLPMSPSQTGELKTLDVVMTAINDIKGKMTKLEDNDNHLFRLRLETDLSAKHPELSPRHVSEVIARATHDPQRRPVWEHAKAMVEEIGQYESSNREKYAKEFGVDLGKFDANRLEEKSPDGGAGALLGKRKLSFTKTGDGYVHPSKAAAEFFGKQGVGH